MENIDKILSEIRPMLMKNIHDRKKDEYIQEYKLCNEGKAPSESDIQNFFAILIAHDVIKNEVDKFIEDFKNHIKRQINRSRIKVTIINTAFFLMNLNVIVNFILAYLKSLNIDIINNSLKNYNTYNILNICNAFIILFILIVIYLYEVIKKEKT